MTRQRRRLVRYLIWTIALVFTALVVVSWQVAAAIIAPRPSVVGLPPEDLHAVAFTLTSRSGSTIAGWHARPAPGRGVVVLLHGIRSSRLAMLERARMLHEAGYATVLIDFQAHGESPGAAITAGHLERYDVHAAVDYARAAHPGEPVAVIGVSLGAAAAVLASPLAIDALIIESVYADVVDAVRNRVAIRLGPLASVPVELLLMHWRQRLGIEPAELRPIVRMSELGCPVFVISGSADRHTLPAETHAIFDAAVPPKALWLVEGAGHVDLQAQDPSEYRRRVLDFLDRHLH